MPLRLTTFTTADALAIFANTKRKVTVAAIVGGGLDYSANDILDVIGGDAGLIAQIKVTTVDGAGTITAVSVETEGAYLTDPTNPVSVSGGTGTGATFNLTLAAAALVQANIVHIEHKQSI